MSQRINSLEEAIIGKLGDRPFYSFRELVKAGVFGSLPGLRKSLKNGDLAFVKVSPRRCVVQKSALLRYLTDNLSHQNKKKEPASNDA